MNYEELRRCVKTAVVEAAHEVDSNDARADRAAQRIVSAVFAEIEERITKIVMKWVFGLMGMAIVGWIVKEALTK